MKHFISLLGIVGVITVLSACSGDDAPEPAHPNEPEATLSSSSLEPGPVPTSSATNDATSSPEASSLSSSSKGKKDKDKDPVILKTRVTIDTGATTFDDPYFSSGIFCWTEGCEEWASSASGPDVPPEDEISVGGDVPNKINLDAAPVIEGLVMTDMRDSQKYDLQEVNGTLWTKKNLDIALSGSNCYGGDINNCKTMGRLYNYSAALDACPTGWRLPTRAEFNAAKGDLSFWIFNGRGKNGTDEFKGDMGFYWLAESEEFNEGEGDEDNCSGSACGLIFVVKSMDYGDGETKFQRDSQTKAFGVRCVQAK